VSAGGQMVAMHLKSVTPPDACFEEEGAKGITSNELPNNEYKTIQAWADPRRKRKKKTKQVGGDNGNGQTKKRVKKGTYQIRLCQNPQQSLASRKSHSGMGPRVKRIFGLLFGRVVHLLSLFILLTIDGFGSNTTRIAIVAGQTQFSKLLLHYLSPRAVTLLEKGANLFCQE
jgi:hypothetical protein